MDAGPARTGMAYAIDFTDGRHTDAAGVAQAKSAKLEISSSQSSLIQIEPGVWWNFFVSRFEVHEGVTFNRIIGILRHCAKAREHNANNLVADVVDLNDVSTPWNGGHVRKLMVFIRKKEYELNLVVHDSPGPYELPKKPGCDAHKVNRKDPVDSGEIHTLAESFCVYRVTDDFGNRSHQKPDQNYPIKVNTSCARLGTNESGFIFSATPELIKRCAQCKE